MVNARKDSPTYGEIGEYFIGEHNPMLIHVPPGVYHGWKGIGGKEALIVNIPTHPYNYEKPDEFRLDPFENNIPYNWERIEG
jgi:dTDP-4-dehydrorhamnose 3,5-epimerase